jgi:hypothetical protein
VNNVHRYHYHNIPLDYFINDLQIDGSSHSPIVGYAADGFPIYYKFLYADEEDPSSDIIAFESSYKLKSGSRPGDGTTAPDGVYDGNYLEDYEYISEASELDECGLRYGKTPEYPDGIHYYVLTDNWPYIPRCLKGEHVDNTFRLGPNCPSSTAFEDCSPITSLGEQINSQNLQVWIYPNPANDYVNIKLEGDLLLDDLVLVRIYSMNGSIAYQSKTIEHEIFLTDIPKGIYFVQLDFGQRQITKKLIIQ